VQRHYRQISRDVGRVLAKLIADFLQDETAICRLSGETDIDIERVLPIRINPQERKIAVKPDVRTLGDLAKEQRVNVLCSHLEPDASALPDATVTLVALVTVLA
jgi:hypothetical protein